MLRLTAWSLLSILPFALSSCDSADEDFPVPRGEVPVERWSSALAAASCSWAERSGALVDGEIANEPCLDYYQRRYEDTYDVQGAVARGEFAWDASRFGRCVTDLAVGKRWDLGSIPCLDGLGAVEVGGSCPVIEACSPGTFCKSPIPTNQAETPIPMGTDLPGTCEPVRAEGEACVSPLGCGEGLFCRGYFCDAEDPMYDAYTCVCAVASREGELCELRPNMSPQECVKGLVCSEHDGSFFSGKCARPTVLP